ncbi:PKD domain-containing protein [Nitrosopumilus sp. S4]
MNSRSSVLMYVGIVAIAFVLLIPITAFAETQSLSGSSHSNQILLNFSEGSVSGTITLEDYIINLSDVRVIERGDKQYIVDKQNDLKILSKQIGSDKYIVLVKINSEDIQKNLRFLTSSESIQTITGQRNLFEAMEVKMQEKKEENLDSLTHRERQDLLKQQKIDEIIKQQREIALINQNQGIIGQSILDSYKSIKSTATGPELLLKNPTSEKKEYVVPPVDTFDIVAFLSVPHNGEWKKSMVYDVLVTDTSGHRYDPEYKSFIGNILKDVEINGTVKNPSGIVLDEFEGVTANDGKFKNTFYIEEFLSTVGEYSISLTATKYFSDDQFTEVEVSDTFFVFPTDSGGGSSNNPPIANAGPDQLLLVHPVTVNLDGSGSSDPDGDSFTYSWVQTVGPAVVLNNGNTATPDFDTLGDNESYTFSLTVTDVKGSSNIDTVTITTAP